VVGVRVGEQEIELARTELPAQLGALLFDLLLQVGIAFRELVELDEVSRASLESIPGGDELSVFRGFARRLPRPPGVIPDTRPGQLLV